jgi:hypothetical protein
MNCSSASGHFAGRVEALLIPENGDTMCIRVGCELSFELSQTLPMVTTLDQVVVRGKRKY